MASDPLLLPGMRDADELAMAKLRSVPRRRLTDITNLPPREPLAKPFPEKGNPNLAIPMENTCCAHLLKENSALLRILAEKNQVIERSSVELQKLRLTVNKLQVQNWQLAQTNSQIVAELNMGKDKLKELRHELGCTGAVLRIKSSELEEARKSIAFSTESGNEGEKQPEKCNETTQEEPHAVVNVKIPKRKRPRESNFNADDKSSKSREMPNDSSTISCQVAEENDDNKQCKRSGISSTLKSQVNNVDVQNFSQSQVAHSKDQPGQNESSISSASVVISILESLHDERAGEAPTTSNRGSGKNGSKRSTRGHLFSNLKLGMKRSPVKEQNVAVQVIPSPRPAFIVLEENSEENQDEQVMLTKEKEGVQLGLNCNSSRIKKTEEQSHNAEVATSGEKKKPQDGEPRVSNGRPSRRATMGKSYKEIPLNVKMRREH